MESENLHDEITAAVAVVSEEDPAQAINMAVLADMAEESVDQRDATPPHMESADASVGELEIHCKEIFTERLRELVTSELADIIEGDSELAQLARGRYAPQFASLMEELGIVEHPFGEAQNSPPEQNPSPEQITSAEEIHSRAEAVDPQFQADIAGVVAHLTVRGVDCAHTTGPPKEADRILEKVLGDYGGDFARLKDAARCRIVCTGDPTVEGQTVIQQLQQDGIIIVDGGIKNGFVDRAGKSTDLGSLSRYTDIKVTAIVQDSEGNPIKAEIVIATPEMAAATKIEHPLYEIIRTIDAEFESASQNSIDVSDPRSILLDRLRQTSRNFYKGVSASMSRRLDIA
jgi:hypothetical protein